MIGQPTPSVVLWADSGPLESHRQYSVLQMLDQFDAFGGAYFKGAGPMPIYLY